MADLAIQNTQNDEKQYIIFNISKEFYGIDVSRVNNIIQMPKITLVPKSPEYFRGVINLRGEIVPIMSLRRRMNLEDDVFTKDSRIVILNLDDEKLMGVVVDEVKEVLTIPESEIEEPSPLLKSEESFISGVGRKNDDLISIFEVDSIIEQNKVS